MEALHGLHEAAAAYGVKHGGRLVEDKAAGLHGQGAGYGDALLLPAGEKMWGEVPIFLHADAGQRVRDPLTDFVRWDTEVLRAEGHIVLYDGRYNLIVGVLKDHADGLSYLPQLVRVGGIPAVYGDAALCGEQDGIEMLGQRGFAGAVCPYDSQELSFLDGDIHSVKGEAL